jgi:hypothetical protein
MYFPGDNFLNLTARFPNPANQLIQQERRIPFFSRTAVKGHNIHLFAVHEVSEKQGSSLLNNILSKILIKGRHTGLPLHKTEGPPKAGRFSKALGRDESRPYTAEFAAVPLDKNC